MIAFALSITLTFLPLVPMTVISQDTIAESISTNTLLSLFFSLIGFALFFVIFYFLADNSKIIASKPTIIALLLGVTSGSAILYLLNIFLYTSYLGLYLNKAANSSISGVFQFFFPALTALLFAELKRRNQTITQPLNSTLFFLCWLACCAKIQSLCARRVPWREVCSLPEFFCFRFFV